MKVVRFAILAAVAALPQFAAAAPKTAAAAAVPRHAAAAPKTPNAQYGALQEVYNFCAGVVATRAAYFEGQSAAVLTGVQNVPAILHDPEYVRGQRVLSQSLQQLSQSEAADACTAIGPQRAPAAVPRHKAAIGVRQERLRQAQ
jgi:hypothetical protein